MLIKRLAILLAILVVSLIVLGRVGDALVDWLWFTSIGYVGVFWTTFTTRVVLFFAVFVISTGVFWLSGALALRFTRGPGTWPSAATAAQFSGQRQQSLAGNLGHVLSLLPRWLLVAGMAVPLGLLTAAIELSNWVLALRFIHQVPYGESDPVFGKDIGFYLFSLPAYVALTNWLLLLLFFSAVVAAVVYWAHRHIEFEPPRASAAVVAHA
ncbi:MAG TPA: UPF0182 family protein, partial [Reyranella sp.]